jgi:hypothetical protein
VIVSSDVEAKVGPLAARRGEGFIPFGKPRRDGVSSNRSVIERKRPAAQMDGPVVVAHTWSCLGAAIDLKTGKTLAGAFTKRAFPVGSFCGTGIATASASRG